MMLGHGNFIPNNQRCPTKQLSSATCFVKLHMLLSPILIGILNIECAVHPLGNIDAAIPDMAVAMAINLSDQTLARRALYRNVLPVPLGPSTKKLGSY